MRYGLAATVALIPLLGSPDVQAQTTKLRLADAFSTSHYMNKVVKFWIDEVAKRTKELEIVYFPSEQMGKAKDLLSLTQSGVVDVGYVAPSFVSDKLPLSSVAELPLGFSESCAGTSAFVKIAKPGGALSKAELEPNGVRLIFAMILPPYQIFTRGKDLVDAAAIQGLKIRTAGAAKILGVRRLGAVPIQIPTPEIYEAVSRGTVDGWLLPMASTLLYDLQGFTKSMTIGENFGSQVVSYMISERRWKTLSASAQQAISEAGDATSAFACKTSQASEDKAAETFRQRGTHIAKFSAGDREKLGKALASVADEWAKTLDKSGKPGTPILNAFNQALGR
jgi:TRAP-type C4-dicarboxylate transport system substrate-binding protein